MPRILVVDDDEALADVMARGLAEHGFEVVRAGSGQEALGQFERFQPQIVLTDLVMPGMQGWSLIGSLRQRNAAVKIVAMTGGGLDTPRTYLKVAQQAGATVVLEKPFTIERLLEALAQLDQPPAPPPPVLPAKPPRPRPQREPKPSSE